jgi:hypothetical protein
MSGKKPATYVEWREVYQSTIYALGLACDTQIGYRLMGNPEPMRTVYARRVHQLYRRIRRIDARLNVEHEVMDGTFIESLMEMLDDEGGQD